MPTDTQKKTSIRWDIFAWLSGWDEGAPSCICCDGVLYEEAEGGAGVRLGCAECGTTYIVCPGFDVEVGGPKREVALFAEGEALKILTLCAPFMEHGSDCACIMHHHYPDDEGYSAAKAKGKEAAEKYWREYRGEKTPCNPEGKARCYCYGLCDCGAGVLLKLLDEKDNESFWEYKDTEADDAPGDDGEDGWEKFYTSEHGFRWRRPIDPEKRVVLWEYSTADRRPKGDGWGEDKVYSLKRGFRWRRAIPVAKHECCGECDGECGHKEQDGELAPESEKHLGSPFERHDPCDLSEECRYPKGHKGECQDSSSKDRSAWWVVLLLVALLAAAVLFVAYIAPYLE